MKNSGQKSKKLSDYSAFVINKKFLREKTFRPETLLDERFFD